jgi:hypothetical protein
VPAQCRVTTNRPAPYQVTFRLINRGASPVYVLQGCIGVDFHISSCASRYTDDLSPTFACACMCEDPSCKGNVACGPCPQPQGVAIAPGGSKEIPWYAVQSNLEDRGTYTCVRRPALPPAIYSVTVPVYPSAEQAVALRDPRPRGRTFELPAAGDVVDVVVAEGGGDAGAAPGVPACEAQAKEPVPVCAPPWSPSVACALDGEYGFGEEGGLVAWTETSTLAPPARYTRTRTYREEQRPPLSCSNQIPRCGAAFDTFTTADVLEAMAAPDVVAAFAEAQPQVYGHDSRPVDGQVLAVRRKDGHGVMLGSPCGPGRPCARPLTDGLAHLAAILTKLDAQQIAAPGCEALRRP